MAIIKCPECGHQVSDMAAMCPSCGLSIRGNVMRCPQCGDIIVKNQAMCPSCHSPLPDDGDDAGKEETARGKHVEPERQRRDRGKREDGGEERNKKTYTPWVIAFVIALLIVFTGIYFYKTTQAQNEMDAYENALGSSEPAVLQNYLDVYREAPREHRDSITAHLERMKKVDTDWENAVTNNSKAAFERYVRMYPGSFHVTEAKIKIDSIDWAAATAENTGESYQRYISLHPDGQYIDDAQEAYGKIDLQKVSGDEQLMMTQIFSSFFNALSTRDENELTMHLDNILTSFLHRANVTKADVISYMNRLYEPADINSMSFRVNNDLKIGKQETGNGEYEYNVAFSVDQMIDRTDPSLETFVSYKVVAKVSMEGKVTELNMKKVVQ